MIKLSITSYPTNAWLSSACWWNSDCFWNDVPVPNWGLPPKAGGRRKQVFDDWLPPAGISPPLWPFKMKMKCDIFFSFYGTVLKQCDGIAKVKICEKKYTE